MRVMAMLCSGYRRGGDRGEGMVKTGRAGRAAGRGDAAAVSSCLRPLDESPRHSLHLLANHYRPRPHGNRHWSRGRRDGCGCCMPEDCQPGVRSPPKIHGSAWGGRLIYTHSGCPWKRLKYSAPKARLAASAAFGRSHKTSRTSKAPTCSASPHWLKSKLRAKRMTSKLKP